MAILSSFTLPSSTFQQQKYFSNPMATSASTSMCRLLVKPIDGNMGSSNAVRVFCQYTMKSRLSVIVKASADIDGTGAKSSDAASEGEKPAVLVGNLPLGSKLQEKMNQKLRMKLAQVPPKANKFH